MKNLSRHLIALCALAIALPLSAAERTKVLLVGTFHFGNPGADLNNVKAVDVLTSERQKEIAQIVASLARFEPTFVGVEWSAPDAKDRYEKYLAGTLPQSRNEVVQLGFRLAKERKARVAGVDILWDFPFEPVAEWAQATGRQSEIDRLMAMAGEEVGKISALQHERTLGGVLHYMNEPAAIARSHSFYTAVVPMGAGDTQPGANLVAAWHARNLQICARLLQAMKPGDRAVVFYGQGHIYLLRQCLQEMPDVELVDPLPSLPAQ